MECQIQYPLNRNANSIFLVTVGFFKHIYVCAQTLTIVYQCTYRKGITLRKDYIRNYLRYGFENSLEFS